MSFVMPLSPYNQGKDGFFKLPGQSDESEGSRPGSPQNDVAMGKDSAADNLPLGNIKSNKEGQREVYLDMNAEMAD